MIIILMSTVSAPANPILSPLSISPQVILEEIREVTPYKRDMEVSPLLISLSAEISFHSIPPSNRLESFVPANVPEGNVGLSLNLCVLLGRGIERQ